MKRGVRWFAEGFKSWIIVWACDIQKYDWLCPTVGRHIQPNRIEVVNQLLRIADEQIIFPRSLYYQELSPAST